MKNECLFLNAKIVDTKYGKRAVLEFVPIDYPYACKAFVNPEYKDCQGKVIDRLSQFKPFDRCVVEYSYKKGEKGYVFYVYSIVPISVDSSP